MPACFAFLVVIATPTSLLPATEPPVVAVVIGASGTPEYEKNFHQWADRWREAATLAKAEHVEIGPFINRLSGNRRVIVTATNSGVEQNYSRFGDHLSTAIADPAADLDHDEQVSLLEAFLSASAGVAKFYEQEARLATEHPLLDDNGDKLGTPPTFFRGIRAVQSARAEVRNLTAKPLTDTSSFPARTSQYSPPASSNAGTNWKQPSRSCERKNRLSPRRVITSTWKR